VKANPTTMKRLTLCLILLFALACTSAHHASARVRAASADPSHGPLVDYGGPVWPVTTVHVVWWGWNPTDSYTSTLAANVSAFVDDLAGSSYVQTGAEYERGAVLSVIADDVMHFNTTDGVPGPAPLPSAVGAVVRHTMGDAMVAQSPSTYVVFGNHWSGYASGACAWHDVFHWMQNGVQQTTTIVYVPNHGIAGHDDGCYPDGSPEVEINAVTWASSHEIMEAMTDPYPCTPTGGSGSTCTTRSDPAWAKVDDVTWEIADICSTNVQYVTYPDGDTWLLQAEWSNLANACVYAGP